MKVWQKGYRHPESQMLAQVLKVISSHSTEPNIVCISSRVHLRKLYRGF